MVLDQTARSPITYSTLAFPWLIGPVNGLPPGACHEDPIDGLGVA
jgi:hypothetical protein